MFACSIKNSKDFTGICWMKKYHQALCKCKSLEGGIEEKHFVNFSSSCGLYLNDVTTTC